MKTFFKIILWLLIIGTIGLTALTVASAMVDVSAQPEWLQKILNFDLLLNYIFYWGYALFATALVSAVISFLFNVISHPSGLVKTLLGLILVVAVVGSAYYFVGKSELLPVPNSAGGVFDNPFELKISSIGLYVTYIVAAFAIVVVAFDILSGLVRRIIK